MSGTSCRRGQTKPLKRNITTVFDPARFHRAHKGRKPSGPRYDTVVSIQDRFVSVPKAVWSRIGFPTGIQMYWDEACSDLVVVGVPSDHPDRYRVKTEASPHRVVFSLPRQFQARTKPGLYPFEIRNSNGIQYLVVLKPGPSST
jgi:hypothetical protein